MTGLPAVSPGRSTASEHIAAFVAQVSVDRLPAAVVARACDLMLDAIGCGIAALGEPFARRTVESLSALAGPGPRAVLGSPRRLPMRDAAMLNGLLMHGLDFDDTHTSGVVHLTVSVLPAVLSLALQTGASGPSMLAAYVAGMEVGARLAQAARGGFHRRGWHPTSLVGTFAAALAAGRLLKLDEKRLVDAQGIALSLAGGSLQFLDDGSWTKRLHPGWAAQAGITAAWLAAGDFPAPRQAYEGTFGLYRLHFAEAQEAEDAINALSASIAGVAGDGQASPWEIHRVAIKPYPACHLLHGATEAAINLNRRGLDAGSARRVVVRVPADVVPVICEPLAAKRRPRSDYDAKFSLPYAVATALLRGRLDLSDLEPAALEANDARALMARIDYEIDPDTTYPHHYPGEVRVECADGRLVTSRIAVNLGHEERPLGRAEVERKFHANARRHASDDQAQALQRAVQALPSATRLSEFEDLLTLQPPSDRE